MAKITLSDVANFQNEQTAAAAINSNNDAIETALENTLSRDGTSPNEMEADLDMNSHRILNLPEPVADQEPLRKVDASGATLTTLAGYKTDAQAAAAAAATSETNAAASATSAASHDTSAGTHDTNAATSASAAATSATNAAASATSANNAAGVIGARWAFESSTTMAAPAVGGLRFNNATIASVTAIAVNAQDSESGNPDISDYVATWDDSTNTQKGSLVIRKLGSPATFAVFTVTSVTDNGTWLQIAVTHVGSAGTWTAADTMAAGFTRAGDKGLDGNVTGPGVSVDGEIALFSGTGGTTLKRASTTGLLKAASGVLAAAVAGTDYLAPSAIGSTVEAYDASILKSADIGTSVQAYDSHLFSGIPQVSQSAAYTLVIGDANKQIYHPSTDNNARTFTIPANASVAFPIGTFILFVNEVNTVTIAITTDTMTLQGSGATGSRTLAANGTAFALKVASTKWIINGTGLS